MCVLDENRICNDCGECMYCDLDPEKVCNNCCACIDDAVGDYKTIKIDEVIPYSPPEPPDHSQAKEESKSPYRRYRFRIVQKDTGDTDGSH